MNYFQDNWLELLLVMDFVQIILEYELIGISLFELELEYKLRLYFDW